MQPAEQSQTKLFAPSASQHQNGRRGSFSLTHGEVPERLQRFLLMPTADGQEPRRLGEYSAFFMALLTVPPVDQQSLMLQPHYATVSAQGVRGPLLLPSTARAHLCCY